MLSPELDSLYCWDGFFIVVIHIIFFVITVTIASCIMEDWLVFDYRRDRLPDDLSVMSYYWLAQKAPLSSMRNQNEKTRDQRDLFSLRSELMKIQTFQTLKHLIIDAILLYHIMLWPIVSSHLFCLYHHICSAVFLVWHHRKHQRSTSLVICEEYPLVTGGFPPQRASNVESVKSPYISCHWHEGPL